jgi:hypothetical protein
MSRSFIVEQKGCPNPGDSGSGKEEVGDKDPHFNHEPHREPYREINAAHEQNQFVSGIEREALAAKRRCALGYPQKAPDAGMGGWRARR